MISFDTIPNNIRIPFVGVEIDNSDATSGPALLALRGLIFAQRVGGSGTAGTAKQITSADQGGGVIGRKSGGFGQLQKWFLNQSGVETWVVPLADAGGGNAATAQLQFTGTSTKKGPLHLYLGDRYLPISVPNGTSATALAALVASEVNLADGLPLGTVTSSAGNTTLPYANKGEVGNSYPITINYQEGQELPPGISCTVVPMSGGSVNPTLDTPIANLGDEWFHTWNHPFTDATSLTAIETELASRFSGTRMIDGLAVTGAGGNFSSLSSLGQTRNSQHSVIFASPGPNPVTPPSELGAAAAAKMTFAGMLDPARPFQTLALAGVRAPKTSFKDLDERNLLLYSGIATTKNAAGGVVTLDRAITTYRTNVSGAADVSYLDATTLLTLQYLRYSFRQKVLLAYPRHKLADTGTPIPAGQKIVTPDMIRALAIEWFAEMEELGLVENRALFEANVKVERNADRNRVDVVLPPDLINQLIVVAARLSFRL